MKQTTWIKQHTASLTGKTVAITGSTGGIGTALCHALLSLGASLILCDRNPQKAASLAKQLQADAPFAKITCVPLELSALRSVKAACETLKAYPIDIFIHNAGAYCIPRFQTDAGIDNVFQIDCAAPYYLTKELLPLFRERHTRVVVVGSIAHTYAKTDPHDIDFSRRKAASLVYGNAKRRLMFSMYALFENETDTSLAVCHPGITLTGITAHYPKWLFALIKHPMKLLFMSPKKACLSILRGCFAHTPTNTWIGPRVLHIWGLPGASTLHTCPAEEAAAIKAAAEALYAQMKATNENNSARTKHLHF